MPDSRIVEPITFDKGLVLRRDPVLLQDGELVTASGLSFDVDGRISARSARSTVNTTILGSINGIHRYMNWVMSAAGGAYSYKWDLNGYCNLYTPDNGNFTSLGNASSANRPRFADYNEFIFLCNGSDNKAFTKGNWYKWGIDNPTVAPAGAAGASGNPSGTYSLYYTFQITFPNGRVYETGPSPVGSVTVSSQKISWTNIGTCNYQGEGLTIKRKLYRYSTATILTYYVATIHDNTTTTYTDDVSDGDLMLGSAMESADYIPPPEGFVDCAAYLNRVFGLKGNTLYPSEPYLPFNFESDEAIGVAPTGVDLVCALDWGDQLYIATADRWRRLQGTSSSTWQIRQTFSEVGCINKHTAKATRYGIISLWYDGIYIFDGTVSKNITRDKIGTALFTSTISSLAACIGEWDGRKYKFSYPTSGTTLSAVLVIDFSNYPNMVFYNDDFVFTAYQYHVPTGIKYFAKSDGYQYEEGGTETIAISLKTGDRVAKDILKLKQAEYLYYDIDTGGEDVTVTIYADGVAQSPTYTLNESSRNRTRIELAQFQGYRFALGLTCADASNVTIYEPWAISFNPFGE